MAAPIETTRRQLILNQISIALFSLVAGLVGRMSWTYWVFVLLYMIVFAAAMQRFANPARVAQARVEEVESGKVLFKEENATRLLLEDVEYQREVAEQMKMAQVSLLTMVPILVYFYLMYQPVLTHIPKYFDHSRLGYVAAFFLLFEGSYLVSRLFQKYLEVRIFAGQKRKLTMINAPRAYIVTSRGIVLQGAFSKSALAFPLTEYEVKVNPARNFVELVKETDKSVVKLRLYTKNPEKLYSVITRKRGETKEEIGRSAGK